MPGAVVTATGPSVRSATADSTGLYVFERLAPGNYEIEAKSPSLLVRQRVRLSTGVRMLDLKLHLLATQQKLDVDEGASAGSVGLDPASNAGALVLRGAQLDALGDKPEDLAADLQAIAGPGAGPRAGSGVFVDGFAGGGMPSKESIREIRINANPFSPEYDRMGLGRVDIFTKPGTDKFKGVLYYNFADAATNSRNPYAGVKAPFRLHEYGGSASGSWGKKASWFVDARRDDIVNGAVINGAALDPVTLAVIDPFTGVFPAGQKRLNVTPRFDAAVGKNHTLTARYVFLDATVTGASIGNANPESRGTNTAYRAHTGQASDTAVLGARTVNELRVQFLRVDSRNTARNDAPGVIVLGALNAGGAQVGQSREENLSTEWQNYVTHIRGGHTLRFGVRARTEAATSFAPVNFGGTFTFAGGGGVASLERYRRTLLLLREGFAGAELKVRGGGAAQFTRNVGDPLVDGRELQTNLGDSSNFAPRLGLAYSPGRTKSPRSVCTAGFRWLL